MMKKRTFNNNGFIDISVMLLVAVFILLVFFITIVNNIDPLVKYINLNQSVRKYTLKMERDGGLTAVNLDNLKNDLAASGFRMDDITITATQNAGYGEDVTLEVAYDYKYEKYNIDGLVVTKTVQTLPMKVSKSTTSKKG